MKARLKDVEAEVTERDFLLTQRTDEVNQNRQECLEKDAMIKHLSEELGEKKIEFQNMFMKS